MSIIHTGPPSLVRATTNCIDVDATVAAALVPPILLYYRHIMLIDGAFAPMYRLIAKYRHLPEASMLSRCYRPLIEQMIINFRKGVYGIDLCSGDVIASNVKFIVAIHKLFMVAWGEFKHKIQYVIDEYTDDVMCMLKDDADDFAQLCRMESFDDIELILDPSLTPMRLRAS